MDTNKNNSNLKSKNNQGKIFRSDENQKYDSESGSSSIIMDKIIPLLLFTSVGGTGWAVRGTAGFGTIRGCVYMGTLLATLWLSLSHESSTIKTRRYSLGWVVIGLIIGIGIGGMRGWSQYPQWFRGFWHTRDYDSSHIVYLSSFWGIIWLFIAGSMWAGFGAIIMVWSGSKNPITKRDWIRKITLGTIFGIGGYLIFRAFPQIFLPLYSELRYDDFTICTECMDAVDDIGVAWVFFTIGLGFILDEIIRKDWTNLKAILIVTLTTGFLWIILMSLNLDRIWWRVWEFSSGAAIGFSFGLVFVLFNQPKPKNDKIALSQPFTSKPNLEKFIVYIILLFGIGWSTHQIIQGYNEVYLHIETPTFNWPFLAPYFIFVLVVLSILYIRLKKNPYSIKDERDNLSELPKMSFILFSVLIFYGLFNTGPLDNAWERAFFILYIIQGIIEIPLVLLYIRKNKITKLK